MKLPFIGRTVGKFEDATSLLLIVFPFSLIYIAVGITVDAEALLNLAIQSPFVGISIAEVDMLFFLIVVLVLSHILFESV